MDAVGFVLIAACVLGIALGDGSWLPLYVVGILAGLGLFVWSGIVDRPPARERLPSRPRRKPAQAPGGRREIDDEDDDDDSLLAFGATVLLARSEEEVDGDDGVEDDGVDDDDDDAADDDDDDWDDD